MHVTTTTIWESQMHRQDLLAIARQQKSAPSREKECEVLTVRIAARHARALITSLVAIAIGLRTPRHDMLDTCLQSPVAEW